MKKFCGKYLLGTLVFSMVTLAVFGMSEICLAAWTAPAQTAPGGNVEAPVNTSDKTQIKEGGLYIGGGSGDIDGDGDTDTSDAIKAMIFASGTDDPNDEREYAEADVSGDGIIDVIDAKLVLSISTGASTPKEAHLEGKLRDSRALGKTIDTNGNVGVSVGSAGVKFADGSIQTTAFDATNRSLCKSIAAGTECSDGFYLKSATLCCPFNAAAAAASYPANTWIRMDVATISQSNDDPNWGQPIKKSFVNARKIKGLKITGYSDDGGYCYAYWGTGNMFTANRTEAQSASYCKYNIDNKIYPITEEKSADWNYSTGYTCPAGYTLTLYNCDGACYKCVKTTPAPAWFTDDNNGNIRFCLSNSAPGSIIEKSSTSLRSIPVGTTVNFQGENIDGPGSGRIDCLLDVMYE